MGVSYKGHRFPLQQALEHTIKCPEQNTVTNVKECMLHIFYLTHTHPFSLPTFQLKQFILTLLNNNKKKHKGTITEVLQIKVLLTLQ